MLAENPVKDRRDIFALIKIFPNVSASFVEISDFYDSIKFDFLRLGIVKLYFKYALLTLLLLQFDKIF